MTVAAAPVPASAILPKAHSQPELNFILWTETPRC